LLSQFQSLSDPELTHRAPTPSKMDGRCGSSSRAQSTCFARVSSEFKPQSHTYTKWLKFSNSYHFLSTECRWDFRTA
jgi:hypothetical protein